jgi:ABC-type antimicrobial peptide transport system permease subunit
MLLYRAARQEQDAPAGAFVIRAAPDGVGLTRLLHAEIRQAAPGLPLPTPVTFDDRLAGALVEERMLAALSTATGTLAAILAAIGIYGSVGAAVARRRREIGIRMALGAQAGQVTRIVVGEACASVAGGLALGLPLTLVAGLAARTVLATVLFELTPADPITLSGAVLVIVAMAAMAAYVPVRRAVRIDPVASIRSE